MKLRCLRERYGERSERSKRQDFLEQVVYTREYVLYIVGGILFQTPSRDVVHPRYLQFLQQTDQVIDYAWGAVVLAHMYRALSKAVKKTTRGFNGCSMLLQLWAWERLNPGRPEIAPGTHFVWPRAWAWAEEVKHRRVNPHHHTVDSFQPHWVIWQPYARLILITLVFPF